MNQPVSIPAGPAAAGRIGRERLARLRRGAEALAIPLLALVISAGLFSIFLLILGKSPVQFYSLIWLGGFGTPFSWSNTLLRAAPLMLMALAVAIPA
ncbi:MAG: ABC transporter permease, partial [Methylobacterium sp.]|nr:ABC transporter permease [Methylobacterium sp.]